MDVVATSGRDSPGTHGVRRVRIRESRRRHVTLRAHTIKIALYNREGIPPIKSCLLQNSFIYAFPGHIIKSKVSKMILLKKIICVCKIFNSSPQYYMPLCSPFAILLNEQNLNLSSIIICRISLFCHVICSSAVSLLSAVGAN